jgi:hypothetical protein
VYQGTIWETLYNSLPVSKGECRVIVLSPGDCYVSHADIDDRYHLNIQGDHCYLIDLDNEKMHSVQSDGIWYDMDASFLHTAANFGRCARVQLVIRKLLKQNRLVNPVSIVLTTTMPNTEHARYLFDNTVSIWLNEANKLGYINNFAYSLPFVKFDIEQDKLDSLKHILPEEFIIE